MEARHWVALSGILVAGAIVITALIKDINGLVYGGGLSLVALIVGLCFGKRIKLF